MKKKNLNLSKNILDKIKKEHIKPTPKIVFVIIFLLKIIAIFTLSLITSIIFSVLIFHIINTEPAAIGKIGIINALEVILPYFWLLVVFLSIGFTYYIFNKYLNGYRYRLNIVIIVNFIIYLLLGFLFFQFNVPDMIERVAISQIKDEKLKDFLSLEYRSKKLWQNPEKGMLGGDIIKKMNDKMIIRDFNGKQWVIEFYKGTKIDKKVYEKNVKRVKIEGLMKNDVIFIATEIKPFGIKGLIDQLYNDNDIKIEKKEDFISREELKKIKDINNKNILPNIK